MAATQSRFVKSGVGAIFVAASITAGLAVRASLIGTPVHDYDEGVYWQTLMAMGSGFSLYRDIFYSQPPMFLELTYAFFAAMGKTLLAARVPMLLSSLVTIAAVGFIGKRLGGNLAAAFALVLVAFNLSDIRQATTLQAEAPAIAFSTVSVALALLWYERAPSRTVLWLAFLAGTAAAAGGLCKLLVAACVLPFLVLAIAKRDWRALAAFLLGAIVTLAIVMLPFLGQFHDVVAQTIAFHTPARNVFATEESQKWRTIVLAFASPLTILAIIGVWIGIAKRDLRLIGVLAWLCGATATLTRITPLWGDHHLSALQPPLIALCVYGGACVLANTRRPEARRIAAILAAVCVAWEVFWSVSFVLARDPDPSVTKPIVADLRRFVAPHSWVITDGQGVAAEAGRQTPPFLVDTSLVRIRTGYLTSWQLIDQCGDARVTAVLFASKRFRLAQMRPFRFWVMQHFHRVSTYPENRELWIR